MARTPLLEHVEKVAGEIARGTTAPAYSRRELVRRAGIAGIGLTLFGRMPVPAAAAPGARVAVVGAGLAGLTAAYRLRQAGVVATVFEASDRVGGRCFTGRGVFADGQLYERGGELIDSAHLRTKQLAQELGLVLDDLVQAEAKGTEMLGWFGGAPYTVAAMSADLKGIWQQLHKDVSAASYPTLYDVSTARGRELDRMSIVDWIEAYVPGGASSRLGQLLDVAYTIEYGLESSLQSSLNMLYLLGYVGPGQFRTFGKSDEKYRVRGGNDQITTRMADALSGQIETGAELVAVRANANGTATLTIGRGSGARQATFDRVVLALPFTMLRTSVDISRAGFSARKRQAIGELGMGTNSKLHLQFSTRFWSALGSNGETYADTGYQNSWEVTRGQPGRAGILVDYTGGVIGDSFGNGRLADRARTFLGQIEPVLPGATADWNGRAALDHWASHPWTKGSYSCWKVGQYTAFAGIERVREGPFHFAGEHTSVDFQGYLNGAVETGERAAAEVLAAL